MPIKYRDISTLGINPVPFSILTPDHHTARIMMLQCGGEIASDNAISHTNRDLAKNKFSCFFRKAREGLASLALTPEYSCPWNVILELVSDPQKYPSPGSLWIIGSESIRLDELNQIKQDTAPFVDWYYETPLPNGNQSFVSPVVYLFRLVAADNTPGLCAIVQFKTHDMGGTNFERDRLIKGKVRYVLSNQDEPASIKLVTIICADALVFKPENELLPNQPYLIIHPQLNHSPYHTAVNVHRSKIFRSGLSGTCEILTLNWSQGFSIGGKTSKDHGGSAYYMSPEKEKEPSQDEARIEANHKKGVYLKFSETCRYAAFLFSPEEAVFVFDTPKVSQFNSPPENKSRSGPCAAATYVWDVSDWQEVATIDDGVKGDFEHSGGLNNMSACEREKLLAISNGALEPKNRFLPLGLPKETGEKLYPFYWHKPRNLNSYHLDANESPQGTVVRLQELQEDEIAKNISCFSTLKTVLSTPTNLPELLGDFKLAPPLITLDLSEDSGKSVRHNVCQQSGKGWVAASFLGDTMPVRAKIVFSNIKKTLSPNRAVLWFRYAGTLECIADEVQQISDSKESLESISRGDEL